MPCEEIIITKKPIGKNSPKKTAFSSRKRGLAAEDVFRFQKKLGKHPYGSCGKTPRSAKNPGETASFRHGHFQPYRRNGKLGNRSRTIRANAVKLEPRRKTHHPTKGKKRCGRKKHGKKSTRKTHVFPRKTRIAIEAFAKTTENPHIDVLEKFTEQAKTSGKRAFFEIALIRPRPKTEKT
jgi:hypothetical protein